MGIPRLDELENLGEARTLLRLDLNVPVRDGEVQDITRVQAALPTLRWLLERTPVVAACSHLGKPKGQPDFALSLRPVAAVLESELGMPVRFVESCIGEEVAAAVAEAPRGSLILLENLRFSPGEKANDMDFARALFAPFSHYVNDAFGTAHRAHASVAAVASLAGPGKRAAGRLMQAELDSLTCLMGRGESPFAALVGGAKVSTKTEPLEALLERVDLLAVGGGMANTFMLAKGLQVGRSLVEAEMVDTARRVLARAADRGVDFLMPEDVVVADAIDSPTEVDVVEASEVPEQSLIVDIGPRSRQRYGAAILRSQSVFWNGPMGVFEVERFAAGTMAVAQAMAECGGFTVVGGGESVMAVQRAGVADKISHVSTGGGASLKFIAGGALPAVEALEA